MPLPVSHQLRPAPFRVAPRADLARTALLGRIALALRPVGKLEDPHARTFALRRAGLAASPRDAHDAAAVAKLHRAALAAGWRLPVLLNHAADTVAFAMMIAAWVVGYCLLCPPARAGGRDALITDERVAVLLNLSPVIVFALLVVGLVWWNRGVPTAANDDGEDEAYGDVALAPEFVPLDGRRRPDRA